MKINSNSILMVWREKANQYAGMKWGNVKFTLLFIAFFVFLPMAVSGFKSEVVLLCILAYILYCTMVAIIGIRIKHIVTSNYRLKYSYQLTTLLYSIYNHAFMAMIWGGALATGYNMMRDANISMPYYPALPLAGLIVYGIVIALMMPSRLNNTPEMKTNNRVDNRQFSYIVQISSGIAVIGAFIVQILSVHGNKATLPILAVVLSYLACVPLLYYLIVDMYKVLLIGFGKWPEIKRSGSEFIVAYPTGEQVDMRAGKHDSAME